MLQATRRAREVAESSLGGDDTPNTSAQLAQARTVTASQRRSTLQEYGLMFGRSTSSGSTVTEQSRRDSRTAFAARRCADSRRLVERERESDAFPSRLGPSSCLRAARLTAVGRRPHTFGRALTSCGGIAKRSRKFDDIAVGICLALAADHEQLQRALVHWCLVSGRRMRRPHA